MVQASIKRNYVLNTAYQLLSLVTPLVTAPYISRVLGAEGVGTYSYTASVVAIFTLFAVLGTTTYGQRCIAQCRDNRTSLSRCFWEIELLSIGTTLVCIAAWLVFTSMHVTYRIYFLILTADLVAAAFDITWFYRGLERFDLVVLRNAAVKFGGVILMFMFVRTPDHVWVYIAILSIGKLLGNITMWIPLRRFVDLTKPSWNSMRTHLRETIVYFVPTAASSVYLYLDKVMIGNYTVTTVENGYYEQTNKILGMGNAFLTSINTVLSSRMSYLYARGDLDEMKEKLRKTLAFIMTLGIPLAFGVASVAGSLVSWYLGPGFEKVSMLLIVGSPLILLMGIHNYLASLVLIPSGQRARSTKGVVIGAAVNFTLNCFLIPRYQSVGAVVATVASELSICLVYLHMSKGYVEAKMVLTSMVRPLLGGCSMAYIIAIASAGMRGSVGTTVFQVTVGVVTYAAAMMFMRDECANELLASIRSCMMGLLCRITGRNAGR